jgi:hypothetical protein
MTLEIALVLGGAALALLASFRLLGAGFKAMPRPVAVLTLVAGAAVVVFGVALARVSTEEAAPEPRVSLEPVRPGTATETADVVHGRIVGPNGKPITDATVTLRPAFDGGKTHRTRTDADGTFAFVAANVTPGTPYTAEVRFDGATFPSEILRSPRPLDDPVRIVVAPTTKDADVLSVRVESIAVVGDKDGVQALHVLTVRNRSQHAYVGSLHLPLLPSATAIDPGTGLVRRFLSLAHGELISHAPVVPGSTDITYTYVAPIGTPPLVAHYRLGYPTKTFELLVGGGLRAEAVGPLKSAGTVRLGDTGARRKYQRLAATELAAGETVTMRIGLAKRNAALTAGALIAAIVLSIALLTFPIVRRMRSRVDRIETPSVVETR